MWKRVFRWVQKEEEAVGFQLALTFFSQIEEEDQVFDTLGVIHKLRWQFFGFFWPPTNPSVDIGEETSLFLLGNIHVLRIVVGKGVRKCQFLIKYWK